MNLVWNNCHHSVCSIKFIKGTNILGSGTGFKIGTHLITNHHVYLIPGEVDQVLISFVTEDGYNVAASKKITYTDFSNRIISGMPEDSWDYVILNLEDEEFKNIPGLLLDTDNQIKIGTEIGILGFQFFQNNLSLKKGIVSSKFINAGVKIIQVDASVNRGNSGGPLIDINSHKVIGIVTRKETGLTKSFENLIHVLDSNILALQAAQQGGAVHLMGINPIQVFQMGQEQLKLTTQEIYRSANVGIGFAFELHEEIKRLQN